MRPHLKIFIPRFIKEGGENYGFIYRKNILPPFYPPPPPNFKGTFAIFPPGYFIITPPSNLWKLRKIPPPPLRIPPPATIKHKRVSHFQKKYFEHNRSSTES